jgi:hypothetical protein
MANRVPQSLGPGQLAEQIAGDEQDIDFFRLAVATNALDRSTQVVGSIDAAKAIGQMPVASVEDSHKERLGTIVGPDSAELLSQIMAKKANSVVPRGPFTPGNLNGIVEVESRKKRG